MELIIYNVLLVTCSPRGENSYSRMVSNELARKLAGADTGTGAGTLVVRDLWRNPLPHVDKQFVKADKTPIPKRTPDDRLALGLSDTLCAELAAADIIVIGSAMINFAIPSTLKSWIDHIVRAEVTFRYGSGGTEGLLIGKKVYLVMATGGVYSNGRRAERNFAEPYLRLILGFLGLTDIETIYVEGVSRGEETALKSLADAREKVDDIVMTMQMDGREAST